MRRVWPSRGAVLKILRDDLHCNAVRFQGRDITRLMTAAAGPLKLGLHVWLSPEMFEQSRETTLAYLVRAAAAAESLRQRFPAGWSSTWVPSRACSPGG